MLVSSAFVERMKQVGIEINRMRSDEFAAFAQQERSRWAKLIGSLDLKIE
jgi:tripartite-type tricarboxylate transporter receptor subunit TctC